LVLHKNIKDLIIMTRLLSHD